MPGAADSGTTEVIQRKVRQSYQSESQLYRDSIDIGDKFNDINGNTDNNRIENKSENTKDNNEPHTETFTDHVNATFANLRKRAESLPVYSLEEVEKHNKLDDAWIILDDLVFNVTNFYKKHPGGPDLVTNFAGQDATDAWISIHLDIDKAVKYLYPLLVGQYKRVTQQEIELQKKNAALNRDFYKLKREFEREGMFEASPWWYSGHIFSVLLTELACYYLLVNHYDSWFCWILAGFFMTASQMQADYNNHDLGHRAVFKSKNANILLNEILMGCFRGSSIDWWAYRHQQHHTKPNVDFKDPSLGLNKLVLWGEKYAKKFGIMKRHDAPYDWQHFYVFFFGAPLMWTVVFPIENIRHVISQRVWLDIPFMIVFYIRYYILYISLLGWWPALKFYFLFRLIEGPWFLFVVLCNHVPMEMEGDRPYLDWMTLQTRVTCNVDPTPFNNWFNGGVNIQIEHHFYPAIPRHNLPKAIPKVKALCEKHGLPHVSKPLIPAIVDTFTALRKSGFAWLEAYNM